MTDWQPISTAPKDGVVIQLASSRYKTWQAVAVWDFDLETWVVTNTANRDFVDFIPTHWMPLPQPPQP